MTPEESQKLLRISLKIVIAYLDSKMELHPNRQLADTSNYLANELATLPEDE